MNVKSLKAFLADLPDDMPVVVPAFDHRYKFAYLSVTTGVREGREIVDDDLTGTHPTIEILCVE